MPKPKDQCLFKCDYLVYYYKCMHSFPNPKKKPDLFAAWVSAVGKRLKGWDDVKNIKYTYKRICDNHFVASQKQSKNRLSPGAVPVNLNRVRQSLVTFVEVEHNYAIPIRGSSEPAPQVYEDLVPKLGTRNDDVLADDVLADDPAPFPVPAVEDPAEKWLFSWQRTDLIAADDPEEPPPPAPWPPADPTLALYCDPNRIPDQTVPCEPAPAEKDVENRCKDCGEVNEGFEFWCVQCAGGALCGACAGRAPHHAHYVLRAPMGCTTTRTQAVLAVIRQQLQNENLSQHETVDDGLKVEVKEEPCEEPTASAEPPAERDPLACEPRAAPEPAAREDQCIAEQIVNLRDHHEPLKLPQLPEAHAHKKNLPLTQRKLVKVSPKQVKRTFLFHLDKIVTTQQQSPQPTPQAFKENLTRHNKGREYQGPKNTSQTAGNHTGTQQNQRPQASMKVSFEPKPSETVIIDLDEDETVEYLEEGLESDVEQVVIDNNETHDNGSDNRETNDDGDGLDDRETNEDGDRLDDYENDDVLDEDYLVDEEDLIQDESDEDIVGNVSRKGAKRRIDAKQTLPARGPSESIIREDDLSDEDAIVNVAGRGVKRTKDTEETSPVKGPYDSMARALPSKAVVQVRPLSSLEIRNWTADRKRLRKD